MSKVSNKRRFYFFNKKKSFKVPDQEQEIKITNISNPSPKPRFFFISKLFKKKIIKIDNQVLQNPKTLKRSSKLANLKMKIGFRKFKKVSNNSFNNINKVPNSLINNSIGNTNKKKINNSSQMINITTTITTNKETETLEKLKKENERKTSSLNESDDEGAYSISVINESSEDK